MAAQIDLANLDALLGGDRALAAELFELFLADLDSNRAAFVQAADAGSPHDLARIAHRWRGSLLNLAAQRCGELAAQVEALAAAGPSDALQSAADNLLTELDACTHEMRALRMAWLAEASG